MVVQKYLMIVKYIKGNAGEYIIEGEGEKTYREFIEY